MAAAPVLRSSYCMSSPVYTIRASPPAASSARRTSVFCRHTCVPNREGCYGVLQWGVMGCYTVVLQTHVCITLCWGVTWMFWGVTSVFTVGIPACPTARAACQAKRTALGRGPPSGRRTPPPPRT
eukprot:3301697-Pyramimonas_sp.AAC.1